MKKLVGILLLLLTMSLMVQSQDIVGTYQNILDGPVDGMYSKYIINLQQDGSFRFTIFDEQNCYSTENVFNGQWKSSGGIITFYAVSEENPQQDSVIDFSDSAATIEGNTLIVTDCKTAWIEGVKLLREQD